MDTLQTDTFHMARNLYFLYDTNINLIFEEISEKSCSLDCCCQSMQDEGIGG